MDPWIGCGNAHRLPQELRAYLTSRGITHINHIADNGRSTFLQQAWKTGRMLQIPRQWQQHWKEYTRALTESHVRIQEGEDKLIWALAKHGKYTPKEGYIALINSLKPLQCESWWKSIWKLKASPKSRLLMWTILRHKIPTRENLTERSFHSPFWCGLCKGDNESGNHLFLTCPCTRELWNSIHSQIPSLPRWQGTTVQEPWEDWWSNVSSERTKNFPLLTC